MAIQKSNQAAPAATVNESADVAISVDPAIEYLLEEIQDAAYSAELRLRETPVGNPNLDEYEVQQLRQTVARLGWMADLALMRLDSSNSLNKGDAAAWMLAPRTARALSQEARS